MITVDDCGAFPAHDCISLFAFTPHKRHLREHNSPIGHAIAEGFPLLIWSRSTTAIKQLKKQFFESDKAQAIGCVADIVRLVDHVRHNCAKDEHDHIGRNLTFIADNPHRKILVKGRVHV